MSRLLLFAFSSVVLLCRLEPSALADDPPPDHPPFWASPVSLSPQCGFIGGCARFDAISLKAGTIGWVRGDCSPRFAALSGWAQASISFLDLAEIGGAFGGHATRDENDSSQKNLAPQSRPASA